MTRTRTALACVVGALAMCPLMTAAVQDSVGNPYPQIVRANIFGLKMPEPIIAVRPPQSLLPRITLTGITTMPFNKRVLLKVQFSANPAEPAREALMILAEGQRSDTIEVLAIDEKAGRVKLNVSGTVVVLDFERTL